MKSKKYNKVVGITTKKERLTDIENKLGGTSVGEGQYRERGVGDTNY